MSVNNNGEKLPVLSDWKFFLFSISIVAAPYILIGYVLDYNNFHYLGLFSTLIGLGVIAASVFTVFHSWHKHAEIGTQ